MFSQGTSINKKVPRFMQPFCIPLNITPASIGQIRQSCTHRRLSSRRKNPSPLHVLAPREENKQTASASSLEGEDNISQQEEEQPTTQTSRVTTSASASTSTGKPSGKTNKKIKRFQLLCVSTAIVDVKSNKVLVSRRPKEARFGGTIEFPGGKIEPINYAGGHRESPQEAAIRELEEEVGVKAVESDLVPLTFVSTPTPGRKVNYIGMLFVCQTWKGCPQSLEGQELMWASVEDLEKLEIKEKDGTMRPFFHAVRKYLTKRAKMQASREKMKMRKRKKKEEKLGLESVDHNEDDDDEEDEDDEEEEEKVARMPKQQQTKRKQQGHQKESQSTPPPVPPSPAVVLSSTMLSSPLGTRRKLRTMLLQGSASHQIVDTTDRQSQE
jgi:8-oxo-dGTP diphosphatase